MTTPVPLGPGSTRMTCPHCLSEIATGTKSEPGNKALIAGLVIALVGGVFGCCLIPCCMDSCKDVHHACPVCNTYLGKFTR